MSDNINRIVVFHSEHLTIVNIVKLVGQHEKAISN